MEQTQRYEVEDLIRGAGGQRATCRKSGVAVETIRAGRRGMRRWSPETRAKLALAWGVAVGAVRWPTEEPPAQGLYTAPPQIPPRRESPKVDMSELYENGELRGEIEALIEREVQKRVAAQTAAQSQDTEGN